MLDAVASSAERRPEIDGCQFREALQVVAIEGGVAANVVPDRVVLTLNHRFAPDRSPEEAEAHVRAVIEPWLEAGDEVEVMDAPAARSRPPPIRSSGPWSSATDLPVEAKLGWTDVARFAELGIPAANFGPGDPTLAHTAGEHVTRGELDAGVPRPRRPDPGG